MRRNSRQQDSLGATTPADVRCPRGADQLKTSPERSRIMASVRSRGNKTTEIRVARILREYRLNGWRRHLSLPGCPDFAFPAQRVVVMVHGCFWHGCPLCYTAPKNNAEFWSEKREYNRARDALVKRQLRRAGWCVVTLWEHDLVREDLVAARVRKALARCRPATRP
jgi:DNA mismatch endonuclease (patch repair protein)